MALIHAIAKVSIALIAIYFHSFEIFIIQIGEIAFCKPEFIISKANYFQNAQKAFALVHECRFRALVLQNGRTVVGEIDIRALLCGREISF
jgi:hypothetical protein